MKRLVLAVAGVALLGAGTWVCAHLNWEYVGRMARGENSPQVGRRYVLTSPATIYLKSEAFREYVIRDEADAQESGLDRMHSWNRGERLSIDKGSVVKVIEAVEGGAKIVVTSGEDKGKIGWVGTQTLIIFSDRIKK